MKNKDLRSEQIALLRFEKSLTKAAEAKASGKPLDKAPLIAGVAAVTAAAASVAEKMGDASLMQYAAEVESAAFATNDANAWLMNLAEAVSKGHNAIEALAQKGAFVFLQAGGTPKENPPEVIASLLMSGLS
ncbi:hypothetical protein ACFOOP_05995 [Marinicaulis aureus]|uniref:Uncharacterized protein n=1 Tax=Hyphococcus aureus TaxID=2666033 RepID=A0ABW1KXF0_9PROT